MRRTIALAAGLASLAWVAFIAVPPASAFPLTACTLSVTSRDASGNVISTATGRGPGGTREDPLIVDPNGTVEWTGSTGGSVKDGTYHVEIFGVPTPLQGPINSSGSTASGSVDLGDILPFDLVGLVYVSGALDVGGSPYCEGSGWISLRGDPVGTPGFVGGAGLALVGVATLLTSVKGRHPFRGAIGGLLGGAGLALLSGVTGVLPLDEQTPLAEVIGMLVLGLLIGVIDFGSLFHRTPVSTVVEAGAPASVPPPAEPTAGPGTQPETGPATTPTTTPTPPVVPPAVPPPVVAPPVAPPPVVPPTVVQPATPAPTPASTQATASTTGASVPKPEPGLEAIRAGINGLKPEVQTEVKPLFEKAEGILRTGPGTLTIGSDLIGRLMAQAGTDPNAVRLVDGAIKAGDDWVTATITPVVTNGTVSLKLDSGGKLAEGMGKLDGLKRFLENANKAVVDAGQRVTSVSVSPTGIVVTTGPAVPSTAG